MRFPTMWYVCPAYAHTNIRFYIFIIRASSQETVELMHMHPTKGADLPAHLHTCTV